jgi:hypothetical protein
MASTKQRRKRAAKAVEAQLLSDEKAQASEHRISALREAHLFRLPDHAIFLANQIVVSKPRPWLGIVFRWMLVLPSLLVSMLGAKLFNDSNGYFSYDISMQFFALMLVGLGFVVIYMALSHKRTVPPPIMRITPEMYQRKDKSKGWDVDEFANVSIRWRNAAISKDGVYDVWRERAPGGNRVWLRFNTIEGNQYLRKIIPISHGEMQIGRLRSGGYSNVWQMRCAILANLACRPQEPLLFEPELFKICQINPITWTRHKGPYYLEAGLIVLTCLITAGFLGGFISFGSALGMAINLWTICASILASLILMLVLIVLTQRMLQFCYPMYFSGTPFFFSVPTTGNSS